MPARSKAQLRFMAWIASGKGHAKGLSRAQASEWVHATKNAKSLPERKKDKR